jgi:chromosomal replication initiator protein
VNTLVNKQTFETWFKPMRLHSIESNRVTIECPSKFFLDWVSEHHSEKIAYAFREALGFDPDLQLLNGERSPEQHALQRGGSSRAVSDPRPVTGPRKHGVNEGERLNPKYTFDEFVVANNSRMTYAACIAVSEKPAVVYNPLFVYGGVGLGKTHLMQAIGHVVLRDHPNSRVHYSSAEAFMNEMIMAIR